MTAVTDSPDDPPTPEKRPFLGRVAMTLHAASRSRPVRVAAVLLLVVPTALAAVYMWIMWDPELYLKQVPVAVVNQDVGATSDGGYENIGKDVLESLTSTGELQFHQVSGEEAVKGVAETRYAFALIIPRDFTSRLHSVTDAHPTKAVINVYYNDFNGTLGPTVANSVITEAQKEITTQIGSQYATQVLLGLNQMGSGLREAADGGGQLKDGTAQLKDGTSQLTAGVGQAADGVTQLKSGTAQLSTGAGQLSDGADELVTGTHRLGDGAVQIRDGLGGVLTPLIDAIGPAGHSAQALAPALITLEHNPDSGVREAARQLATVLAELDAADENGTLGQIVALRDGTAELARQLSDPQADYLGGVLQLADGAHQLDSGAEELDAGMGELNDGMPELLDGARQLDNGTGQVDQGMGQLTTGLTDGAGQAPNVDDVPASADMFATPMTVDVANLQPSQTVIDDDRSHKEISRGAGPVIVVLGCFLLCIVLWMIIRPVRPRADDDRSAWRQALLPILRSAAVGAAAGVLFALILAAYGASVGWSPGNWWAMVLVVAVVGIAAALTTQMFVVIFGKVFGSIASFAFFMYQIFAFGGIFPLGTTPPAFRPFRDISPMTYAQRAILRTHLELYDTMYWVSLAALVVCSLGAVTVGALVRYWAARTADDDPPDPESAAAGDVLVGEVTS
ncbi:YhgE/Pip family protein [Gordonia sp. NPDC003376]